MTAFLPPNLLALFAPRDPIPYLAPLDKPAWLKRAWPYTGLAKFVREFEVRGLFAPFVMKWKCYFLPDLPFRRHLNQNITFSLYNQVW